MAEADDAAGDDAPAGGAGDALAEDAADDAATVAAAGDEAADEEPPAEEVAEKPKRGRSRAKAAASADEVGRDDERSEAGPAAEEETPKRRGRKRGAEPEPAPEPQRRGGKPVPVGVTVRAQAKYVRTSARKARLVCDHIRGKDVNEARAILAFTPRGAATAWSKLLESAVANAEHNHELVGEELRILEVHADEGPTLKRFRPRAMGRATRIRKRTSHLTIQLTPKD